MENGHLEVRRKKRVTLRWILKKRIITFAGIWESLFRVSRPVVQKAVSILLPLNTCGFTSLQQFMFRNTIRLYVEDLLAPRPTPKQEDHPLSAVRDCLFNIFAATVHIGGRSSIRNLRTRHAVLTGTHLSRYFTPQFHHSSHAYFRNNCACPCFSALTSSMNRNNTSNVRAT